MKRDLLKQNYSSILDKMNLAFLATDDDLMQDRITEAMFDYEFVGKLLTGVEPHLDNSCTVEERMSSILTNCISNIEDALRHMKDADWRYSKTVEEQGNIVVSMLKEIIEG
ncbi:hypothetical protein P4493_05385 [Bacillus thuringiensis]|jgi:hypothetical protein|uniref:Uncharacterized protein n=3 Tax=Bacillus thuringiensis TaxID=1428 RepID=A0A0B5NJ51_BACTU|nr:MULTISPECIES: hypothetical protein [Bacillus]MEC2534713.1 hypothetical protein [Bacillus cereus]MED1153571.1 hypothetical protein [Bacillus paranthracis]OUB09139.1 hypothetical protein BK708_31870 [Bacillus thuringiensis serovar yunnanensis]AFQ29899.1 hypothetical protein BTF1_28992 [Bacillus thuringiensis HD-789]AJG73981.1 hypothetical protein BF38_5686 [Bacillus thuringiensis]